jgi:hypothetical protein
VLSCTIKSTGVAAHGVCAQARPAIYLVRYCRGRCRHHGRHSRAATHGWEMEHSSNRSLTSGYEKLRLLHTLPRSRAALVLAWLSLIDAQRTRMHNAHQFSQERSGHWIFLQTITPKALPRERHAPARLHMLGASPAARARPRLAIPMQGGTQDQSMSAFGQPMKWTSALCQRTPVPASEADKASEAGTECAGIPLCACMPTTWRTPKIKGKRS